MNYTTEQQRFIDARFLQIKREVLAAVIAATPFYVGGRVPPITIHSFSDLHDFCDANTLGGLCDDEVATMASALFPSVESDDSAGNAIQGAVHGWLESRAMLDDVTFIARLLLPEQISCLLDDDRVLEAHGMLLDLESRVGPAYGFTPRAVALLRAVLPEPRHVVLQGNWYALDGTTLISGPVLADGAKAFDSGYEVDFGRLDADSRGQANEAHEKLLALLPVRD
jgi:hypothetical protein